MFKNHDDIFISDKNDKIHTVNQSNDSNDRDYVELQKKQVNSFCESIYSSSSERLVIDDGINTADIIKNLHDENQKINKNYKEIYAKFLKISEYNSKLSESVETYKDIVIDNEKFIPYLTGGAFSLGVLFGICISLCLKSNKN